MKRSRFHAELSADGALEILIYGEIVDAGSMAVYEAYGIDISSFVSALNVKRALDGAGASSKIRLRINSPGGDAFEGMAIHSLLSSQAKPVEVYIDGIAASAASIIAMAGAKRVMGRSAMMMIHDASSWACGNSRDMRKMADTLDKVDESIAAAYVDRSGLSLEAVQKLMDEEAWLSAQDCMAQGFATEIAEPPAADEAKAMAMARRFAAHAKLRHVPEQLRAAAACACDCDNCSGGDCSECTNKNCDDANCVDCPMQAGAGNQAPAAIKNTKGCACDCTNCVADRCSECTQRNCADKNCIDCPMQTSGGSSQAYGADYTALKRAQLELAGRQLR